MTNEDLAIEKLLNDIELRRLGYHIDGTALYDEGDGVMENMNDTCYGECDNCEYDCNFDDYDDCGYDDADETGFNPYIGTYDWDC